ncbi:MAG: molybdopterin-binding protein [Desulforegulaceae bacterium]|nr:molybdopterin-binding protein [Desulforegulaceae bacterium]
MGLKTYIKKPFKKLDIAVVVISSSKNKKHRSGNWIEKRIKKEGHNLLKRITVKNNFSEISTAVTNLIFYENPHCIITTGGTGLGRNDITIETISPLFTKEITGFSSAFTSIRLEQIDSPAILSRAKAGIAGKTVIFCLPKSVGACKLASKALIFPELEHIVNNIRN